MLKIKSCLLIGVTTALFTTGLAQDTLYLSIDQAIDEAINNSDIIKIDSVKTSIYDTKIAQTKALLLPQVNLTSTYSRISNNVEPFRIAIPSVGEQALNPQILNQFYNRLSIQQPIFQGLKPYYTYKTIIAQKSAEALNTKKDKLEVKNNIIQWYYNLYQLQQTEILLDSSLQKNRVLLQHLKNLKEANLILNNDVMRASLEETQLMSQKADIEAAMATAHYNLMTWMGREDENLTLIPSWQESEPIALPILDSLVGIALQERTELKNIAYLYDANDYQQKAARSAYMPSVALVGNGYYNNPNTRIFPQEQAFKATWDVGISLQWNIMQAYSGKKNIQELQQQQQILDINSDALHDGIAIEVNTQYQNYRKALNKIPLMEQAIVQAKENQRITSNRYFEQLTLLNDVLDANYLVLKAETDLLNAQIQRMITYYNLQKSLGK